tara:strand:+ start:196 stop:312 length:117 start_codon:yes stop_codon:yes gene_type:complete
MTIGEVRESNSGRQIKNPKEGLVFKATKDEERFDDMLT